ncbi:hypothetical protein EAO72_16340 [Streptomyces sp. or43]|nr:hypothetical protein EAO72_16340 [Streptomyces sp. or43]
MLGAVRELEAAELPSVGSVLTGRPLRRFDRTVEWVVAHGQVLTSLIEELHLRGMLSESALRTLGAAAVPRPSTPREERELCRTERLSAYWH